MNKPDRIVGLGTLLCAALGVMSICGCGTSLATSSPARENLAVKVSLHGQHHLSVELRNVSGSSIKLPVSNLPWEWRYSMWVKAFEDDASGSPLDERLIPADPPINRLMETLVSGKPVQGQIDLRSRFPDLEEVLKRRDVIIFWSYVPELENSKTRARRSGSLVILKR